MPFEIEQLTSTQKINEYIMTGLRTIEGVDLNYLKALSEEKTVADIMKNAEKFIQQNLVEQKNDSLILTQKENYLLMELQRIYFNKYL